jgi:2-keto-4-pentenoate hydratase/2-oxohepta-3-ene-1,7-dioic acid hydratase in catechol pathway
MKIARFLDPKGTPHFGILAEDGLTAELLSGNLYEGLVPTRRQTPVSKLLVPVEPPNIFAIGLNYRAHAKETGAREPEHPVVFMKPTSALTSPGDPIVLPAVCEHGPEVDYEAELAVVIGRAAKNVPPLRALDYVLGYTCANDVSARRWQKHGGGGQWVRGKSFDSFCPFGPLLVTVDEIPDPQRLAVSCVLNGQTMQDANTADMIFSVSRLISHLSRDTTLLPGTIILTGTPPGVGFVRKPPVFLSPGDRVGVQIEGIGVLENPVCAASPSLA